LNDPEQHQYFLGNHFEGISGGASQTVLQLSPARSYILHRVNELTPFHSTTFHLVESLALGGLGVGWGLGCCVFSDAELDRCGLPCEEMKEAYQLVADRVGISGEDDDARPYTSARLTGIQPALPPDDNAFRMLERYSKVKTRLNRMGFFLGRPALALLSQQKEDRQPNPLNDMDFYSDPGRSAWRPQFVVEALQKHPGFSYQPGVLVTRFEESPKSVEVLGIPVHGGERRIFRARKVIIAAGLAGTARIVLRSFNRNGQRLPVLSNPYTYLPSLMWASLGRMPNPRRSSMCQLSLFYDPDRGNARVSVASLYSYGSLLLHRIIRQTPLPMWEGRIVMQLLHSSLVIAGIHDPDEQGGERYLELRPSPQSPTGDTLFSEFRYSQTQLEAVQHRTKAFARALRMLGCLCLRRIDPGPGSSIHYAGTLPFSAGERPFTLNVSGRLHGTTNVFVADGSGFRYLPAKGITLTLMANGHRTALSLLKALSDG